MVPSVKGDIITDWNTQLFSVVKDTNSMTPLASREMAILHTAIYNSIQGITNNYQLYSTGSYDGPSITAVSGASIEAAAASAAYTVMEALYDDAYSAQFQALYSAQMSSIAEDPSKYQGMNFGVTVANDILNWRNGDGSGTASTVQYNPAGTFGSWVSTPPLYASDPLLPGWGAVTPFGVASTAGYQTSVLAGTTATTNSDYLLENQYTADYNEVKDLGAKSGSTRTMDQTSIAHFWAGSPGTITAVGLWNEIANTVSSSAGLNLEQKSRLFAMLNVALADAAIISWDNVYDNNFWRPVSGIVFGEGDGNDNTLGDVSWESLIDSPVFPEYGAPDSAIAAAAARVLATLFGDTYAFSLGSDIDGDGTANIIRLFNSFSQAAQEAGDAAIYGGTQFRTSVEDGQAMGDAVGAYVAGNYFAPVPEPSAALLLVLAAASTLRRRRSRSV